MDFTNELNEMQEKIEIVLKTEQELEKRSLIVGKQFLETLKDKRFSFEEYYEDTYSEICVTYDGGSHPEYAANPYSNVLSIFLNENNEICFELEDTPEQNAKWMQMSDVYSSIVTMLEYYESNPSLIE